MAGKNSKGKPKRGPGNPKILEQNQPYRIPAISPGEKGIPVTLRIPQSKLEQVDSRGKRADVIREAIDLFLFQAEVQATVWLLFENNPGIPRHILGVFSSPSLAMEAPRVQEMIGPATWQERTPGLWICEPSGGEDFYFTVESWQVVN